MDDDVHVLSVGVVLGGPTRSLWEAPLERLMSRVSELRQGVESSLNVNVVFQVPGSVLAPDFQGVRTGRYSRRNRHLMVQVALPSAVPDDPDGYLRTTLLAAVDEADTWCTKRHMNVDLSPLRRIAHGV